MAVKYCCVGCNKIFRDNYDLNRHRSKKKPCVKKENEFINKNDTNVPNITIINNNDTSGGNITIINNNTININFVIGEEDYQSYVQPDWVIDHLRNSIKTNDGNYIKAGNLVTDFHTVMKENSKNIFLKNIKSPYALLLTPQGEWVRKQIDDAVDKTIKTRAGQLITYKDKIEECNSKVFKSRDIQQTWSHIYQFSVKGREHVGIGDQTRRIRSSVKIALLE